jgi:hypothetical protein
MTPLYLPCPPGEFAAAPHTETFSAGASAVKIDAVNCKVWLNLDGSCSVQQYGRPEQARRRYEEIKKEIG